MTSVQLTLDGREVPVVELYPGLGLGKHQARILSELRVRTLTSTQAGVIVHAIRGHCGYGSRDERYHSVYAGEGCCRYCASDGGDVMKSLARRGLVVKVAGIWCQA